jgi:hypothetical protein
MVHFRFALLGASLFAISLAPAQEMPRTLAEYLPRLRGDGPVFALDAAKVRAQGDGKGLDAYRRQRMKVGGLLAIVPTEMVVVDDSVLNRGNLTDGLPAQTKLLYLLQSLNSQQWRQIAGKGIGVGDLQGEQQDVFLSILPKRLAWRAYRVKKDGLDSEEVGKGAVLDKELSAVKIRIFRDLAFDLNLGADPQAFTTHSSSTYRGKPGDSFWERDGQFEESNDGANVRQVLPNVAKPSAVKYDAGKYDALVTVPKNATVREVLAAVGGEFYADLRVADLKVTCTADQVRTGDLLKALALGVTGTYRRVGPAYVLTSDPIGLGTRKLHFSLWWEERWNRSHQIGGEWRRKIGERMDQAVYEKGSPFEPNAAMQAHLSVQDSSRGQEWIAANDLTPPVREYLSLINRQFPRQRIDTGKTRITSQFRYGFVLPDGRELRPEIPSLGSRMEFGPRAAAPVRPPTEPPAVSLPIRFGKSIPRLTVRAETPALARMAAELAFARGFEELWVETQNPAALAAAIEIGQKQGRPVRLLLRPWGAKTDDPDRNLLGDTGSQLAPRLTALDLWKEMQATIRTQPLDDFDRMAPYDPERSKAWEAYVAMAKMPGLAGVIVSGTHTQGYEAPIDREVFYLYGNSAALAVARNFGYSDAQRLAFLRKHGMDPIDIVPTGLKAGPDLRQPFFLDDGLRGTTTVYDGRDVPHPGVKKAKKDWALFRSEAFSSSMLKLLNDMGATTSVIVSPLANSENPLPRGEEVFVYWDVNKPIPLIDRQRMPALVLAPLGANPTASQIHTLHFYLQREEIRTSVDLRGVAPGAWASVLDRFLAKPEK